MGRLNPAFTAWTKTKARLQRAFVFAGLLQVELIRPACLPGPPAGAAYWLAAAGAMGAEAPFFIFCFFGFLTCFWVGGEYELTELLAAGAAV